MFLTEKASLTFWKVCYGEVVFAFTAEARDFWGFIWVFVADCRPGVCIAHLFEVYGLDKVFAFCTVLEGGLFCSEFIGHVCGVWDLRMVVVFYTEETACVNGYIIL